LHQLVTGIAPPAPATPFPAFTDTRVKLTPFDPFTIAAMLELPAPLASWDTNAMSSKCADVTLSTSSAYPGVLGATSPGVALYVHEAPPSAGHDSPPNTSAGPVTFSDSLYAAPHT
jgi:hypothetical protein